jgi:putative SOS response-associated peptidase YedK
LCGRVIQASPPLRLAITDLVEISHADAGAVTPRFNGAPGQQFLIIRENHETGKRSLDLIKWGLIPHWCKDAKGGRKPINAKAETVHQLPSFRDAFRRRRAILPIDGFFEWRAIGSGKQPYAIAMANGSPFGLAAIWENWKDPTTGEWVRTFAVITVPANELVSQIHDRMPAILRPEDYSRWLGSDADVRDLIISYPAALMRIWPISSRVNSPKHDDPSVLDELVAQHTGSGAHPFGR